MKFKNINFNQSHIPNFKKYIAWQIILGLLSIALGCYQVGLLIDANKKGIEFSLFEKIASYGCLFYVALFLFFSIVEVSKYLTIIKRIKSNNFYETKRFIFNYSKPLAFGNLIRVFEYIMFTACAMFVVGFATFCVLDYVYYSTINYYLPVSIMLLISCFYGVKNNELKYDTER